MLTEESFVARLPLLGDIAMGAALLCGVTGIGGLLAGSGVLVWETRYALAILTAEAQLLRPRAGPGPEGRPAS